MPPVPASIPFAIEARFTVKLAGAAAAIGSFQECTGMGVRVRTKEYREGGCNSYVHRLPDGVEHDNVVLKHGLTNTPALLQWLNMAAQTGVQAQQQALIITLNSTAGQPLTSWSFTAAWPVKWTGPNLNAGAGQVATESLEIAYQQVQVA